MCINLSLTHSGNSNRNPSHMGLWQSKEEKLVTNTYTHIHAQKKQADGSGFHYREKKGKGSSSHFIPYEGHIPEHAALLPQETWGKVGGAKEWRGRNNSTQGENGPKVHLVHFLLFTQDQIIFFFLTHKWFQLISVIHLDLNIHWAFYFVTHIHFL